MSGSPPVYLSAIDEERFGIRTARASHVTLANLEEVVSFCNAASVRFLIARCPAADLATAQTMEEQGFRIMDTLVYFSRELKKGPIPDDTGNTAVRPVQPQEVEQVRQVAAESFQGYYGHYHADPRLDRKLCDETYVSWAVRSSTSKEVADEVLVAEQDGRVAGFATLRLNTPDEGEGVLFGVAPFAQGKGIYRSLMIHGMKWCLSEGARRMVVSTQITNLAVQKVWTRIGFEPSQAFYTFHKWFDQTG